MASSLQLASPGGRQASKDFLLPHRSLVLGGFYGEGGVTLGRLCGRRQVVFSHCFGLTGIRGVPGTGQCQSWGQAHANGCGSKQPKAALKQQSGCRPSLSLFYCILRAVFPSSPNFYILDEPTNHLDMETIEALAKALNKFRVRFFQQHPLFF